MKCDKGISDYQIIYLLTFGIWLLIALVSVVQMSFVPEGVKHNDIIHGKQSFPLLPQEEREDHLANGQAHLQTDIFAGTRLDTSNVESLKPWLLTRDPLTSDALAITFSIFILCMYILVFIPSLLALKFEKMEIAFARSEGHLVLMGGCGFLVASVLGLLLFIVNYNEVTENFSRNLFQALENIIKLIKNDVQKDDRYLRNETDNSRDFSRVGKNRIQLGHVSWCNVIVACLINKNYELEKIFGRLNINERKLVNPLIGDIKTETAVNTQHSPSIWFQVGENYRSAKWFMDIGFCPKVNMFVQFNLLMLSVFCLVPCIALFICWRKGQYKYWALERLPIPIRISQSHSTSQVVQNSKGKYNSKVRGDKSGQDQNSEHGRSRGPENISPTEFSMNRRMERKNMKTKRLSQLSKDEHLRNFKPLKLPENPGPGKPQDVSRPILNSHSEASNMTHVEEDEDLGLIIELVEKRN